jgi:hypothetical protein
MLNSFSVWNSYRFLRRYEVSSSAGIDRAGDARKSAFRSMGQASPQHSADTQVAYVLILLPSKILATMKHQNIYRGAHRIALKSCLGWWHTGTVGDFAISSLAMCCI